MMWASLRLQDAEFMCKRLQILIPRLHQFHTWDTCNPRNEELDINYTQETGKGNHKFLNLVLLLKLFYRGILLIIRRKWTTYETTKSILGCNVEMKTRYGHSYEEE